MTYGFFTGDILRGLAARVLFFLSLALLPIGLIAIAQTREIALQNEASTELSLIALTERASTAERQIFQEAFGAAEALASIVLLQRDDPQECSEFMRTYLDATDIYGVVGFIQADGMMNCSSADKPYDFSGDAAFQAILKNPERVAAPQRLGRVSNQLVAIVSSPVFSGDTLEGFVSLSIPKTSFQKIREPELPFKPITLFTFNPDSELLSSDTDEALAKKEMPSNVELALLIGRESTVFKALNQEGVERVYALQTIVGNAAYAMTVWPTDAPIVTPGITTRLSSFLPVLMWAASLIVAFWALNRLALRHIRKLGRQMRRFALNRNLPRMALGSSVPSELREMEAAFISMGESILRDEAQLEDSLREKNILLKEVHHRVKNNLQLISSIMNMQIRQAKSEDARRVLRRLQERILSLATVHKSLYQNDNLVQVDAKALMSEVVNQLLAVGLESGSNVKVEQEYDDMKLDADDAAPLTLLVSEAVTNAVKNVQREPLGSGRIAIRLTRQAKDRACLSVANTVGGKPGPDGTGLGSRLIEAFARQLNGEIEVEETAEEYRLVISFPLPQTQKEVYDY
ncbi:MAG: sensor histidine kinase [Sulfitobacter sp.]|nr:sensor histidine kinase [Sulfitobacter sp.]